MSGSWQASLKQAVAAHSSGKLAAAEQGYRAVLSVEPEQPDALHLLGVLLDQQGQHQAAVALIRRAIGQAPQEAAYHGNLGTALLALGHDDEAESAYRAAIACDKAYVDGHYNLANLLRRRGDTAAARAAFEAALALRPDHLQARNNLAMLLWEDVGDMAGATAQFAALLAQAPDWPVGRMNHGLFLLAMGDYTSGWPEYEWRWRNPDYAERDWGLGLPRWQGEKLDGPLLLWGEQGVGDQILYGTMLADAAVRSQAPLVVAVDRRLVDLFARSLQGPGITVVARGTPVQAVAQCPFGSMGRWLRLAPDDFSAASNRGYLKADDAMRQRQYETCHALAGPGRKVIGLSWRSGNASIGEHKSIPLPTLLPLLRRPDIFWVCLQYGDVAADLAWFREQGIRIHHNAAADGLHDMDAFAALVAAMDRVITVSNTAVHMAGGLGVDCDLLLPKGRGRLWYWPAEGGDSLWYAEVRVLRQALTGQWDNPMSVLLAS